MSQAGNLRTFTVEAENKDDAHSKAWDEGFNGGGDDIWKIIDVEDYGEVENSDSK